jgi:hypothetical protein
MAPLASAASFCNRNVSTSSPGACWRGVLTGRVDGCAGGRPAKNLPPAVQARQAHGAGRRLAHRLNPHPTEVSARELQRTSTPAPLPAGYRTPNPGPRYVSSHTDLECAEHRALLLLHPSFRYRTGTGGRGHTKRTGEADISKPTAEVRRPRWPHQCLSTNAVGGL